MSDLPDPADRIRAVNDEIATKGRWLREIRRRTDSNGKRTPEADREAREAAGVRNPDERRAA